MNTTQRVLRHRMACLPITILLCSAACFGQSTSAPASAPAGARETTGPIKPGKDKKYVSRAWGTKVEPDPPSYVKTGKQLGLKDMDWLLLGAENRTRYESRNHDIRRPGQTYDDPFQMRSQGFVGIKDIIDPLRFGLEFVDGRQFGSRYPDTTQDVDENDIYQAYGELYLKDALGKDQPIQFDFGRMFLEYVNRKLVSRSRWRSTTSNFDGFRLRLGQRESDWQLDFFAVQPVQHRVRQFDREETGKWFYGLVGAWRGWSKWLTIEPYYFILDDDRDEKGSIDRTIHTMGLRAYGLIGDTGFDYDFDNAFQFGDDGERHQRAYASIGELGYTFRHPWKPRLSWWSAYATGDRDPNDGSNNRFDRLYGDSHGFSMTDAFSWQNLISTKLRLEFSPLNKLKADASYGGYWLADASDVWPVPGRRDVTGSSGSYVGQELEMRLRYQIDPRMEVEVGYSHFIPGTFIDKTGSSVESDFFYVSTNLQL